VINKQQKLTTFHPPHHPTASLYFGHRHWLSLKLSSLHIRKIVCVSIATVVSSPLQLLTHSSQSFIRERTTSTANRGTISLHHMTIDGRYGSELISIGDCHTILSLKKKSRSTCQRTERLSTILFISPRQFPDQEVLEGQLGDR